MSYIYNSYQTGNRRWDVAARWEPYQMVNYEGASVMEISFFPLEPSALYKVRVWVGAGAENLVVDQAVTPECGQWTGITDPDSNTESFNLYPNPADDHVYLTTSGDLKRVTVYDATGRLVKDEITIGKQYELSTSGFTIGIYIVKVETATGVITHTLTIGR